MLINKHGCHVVPGDAFLLEATPSGFLSEDKFVPSREPGGDLELAERDMLTFGVSISYFNTNRCDVCVSLF